MALSVCLPLGVAGHAWAVGSALAPPLESAGIAKRLAVRLPQEHVTHAPFDDAMAGKAWDAFLSSLDHDRVYFLESDIARFRSRRNAIDEELKEGNVSLAYEVFAVWRERVGNRCAYVQTLVEKGLDLDRKETCERERRNAPWARDESEWNEIWRRKIKNECVQRVVTSRLAREDGAKTPAEEASVGEAVAKGYRDYDAMIEKTDAQRVLESYLGSFCRAYDPHCEYMSPAAAEEFNDEMKLSSVGIGVILSIEDGMAKIERLIPGGPAARDRRDIALEPGDRIVAVAEENRAAVDARHLPLFKVSRLVRGEKGAKVVLTVIRAGEADEAARQVDLVRDEVKMEDQAAKCETIAATNTAGVVRKLAFVTLPAFYSDAQGRKEERSGYKSSAGDVGKILLKAREDGVQGVVLDLRNNGGGSFGEAVQTVGLFIRYGPVVQVREGRRVGVQMDDDRAVAYSGPLVVLVNRHSASASEIVAGALQDYGRAVVVGDSRTHGKGTVQTVMPIGEDAAMGSLKVTTALFYRPTGNSTQLKGVTSDIVIPSALDYAAESGEDRLPNALEWSMIGELAIAPWGDLRPVIAKLEERSLKRRAANPRFGAYTNLLARIADVQQSETLSLNIDERMELARTIRGLNEQLRGADGKEAESGAGGKGAWDPAKEEALNILSDLGDIQGPAADASGEKAPDAVVASSQEDTPEERELAPRIEALIHELGDGRYAARQRAAEELRKIGYPAVAALEVATRSDDPEVAETARLILKDARLGVTSAWPKALAQEIGRYEAMGAGERDGLIRRVISEMKEEAVPFLLVRLGTGDRADGRSVCDALKQAGTDKMAEKIAGALKEPRNEWQARAAAWAHSRLKHPEDALRALAACHVQGEPREDEPRESVIEQAVRDLRDKFTNGEYVVTATAAERLAQAEPTEARFLYLRAAALTQLGKAEEARELADKAAQLNPREEAPHYTAGDMLLDLGLDDLSVREWEAILRIAPVDDVYDINARMRLGRIAATAQRNQEAAEHFEKGLNLYRQRRAGGNSGFGMIGTTEEGLERTIEELRRKGGGRAGLVAGQRGKQLRLQIESLVKDGKEKDLRAALKSSRASMNVKTEPLGIRVLDLEECRLAYDRKTEALSILFNDSAVCKPQHCALDGKKTKVVVTELDCVYVFEVDSDSAEVRKLERFEKDYEVKIVPDEGLRGHKGFDVKIGDTEYSWKDLLEGTRIDYLPPVLELRMEGPGADGKPEPLQFRISIDEKAFEAAGGPQ